MIFGGTHIESSRGLLRLSQLPPTTSQMYLTQLQRNPKKLLSFDQRKNMNPLIDTRDWKIKKVDFTWRNSFEVGDDYSINRED